MLAQMVRREAIRALAEAVSEADRSAALAQRTRDMLDDYGLHRAPPTAASLREHAAFVNVLGTIAQQAEQARADAQDQAGWQARSLAAAETRMDRLTERRAQAQRDLTTLLDQREQPVPQGMARKLLSDPDEAATQRPAQRSRSRP